MVEDMVAGVTGALVWVMGDARLRPEGRRRGSGAGGVRSRGEDSRDGCVDVTVSSTVVLGACVSSGLQFFPQRAAVPTLLGRTKVLCSIIRGSPMRVCVRACEASRSGFSYG